MTWTKPFHGVSHLTDAEPHFGAYVTQYPEYEATGTQLNLWPRGAGSSTPIHQSYIDGPDHLNRAKAKLEEMIRVMKCGRP